MSYFNHGTTSFPGIDVKKVEEIKGAKFVCELALLGKGGWTESPVQIYYQPNPDIDAGHSHYFGLTFQNSKLLITDAMSVVGIAIAGIQTQAGEIIYSRFRHDFRSATTEHISVDGGLDYLRLVGSISAVKRVILTIHNGELIVVEDAEEIERLIRAKEDRVKCS